VNNKIIIFAGNLILKINALKFKEMALDNLVSAVFSDTEIAIIDAALSEIENILKGKAVNLTPKERQTYTRRKCGTYGST
jgi:hypothetical protein